MVLQFIMYLLPLPTRGLVASIISGGLAILLAIQFFYQSRLANFLLGGIMFLIAKENLCALQMILKQIKFFSQKKFKRNKKLRNE